MDDALLQQLVLHEGLRLFPYLDTVGKWTIGVGRNLTDVGISREEAFTLLEHDVLVAEADLATFAWWASLDPVRRRAIVDLRFNLGPGRFRGFHETLAALARRDYGTAAAQLRSSKWFTQVGTRGVRLALMVQTGEALDQRSTDRMI